MIEKYTGFTVNKIGGVNAFFDGIETTLTEDEIKLVNDSGVEIAPYIEPAKTPKQLKAEVAQELKSLDASSRTLANALLGDQWAIDELKRLEAEKVILRDKLNSL